MKRIGLYGGTFDPIHHGHLITAQSVLEIRKLDKIIFIPSFISPLRNNFAASPAKHRLNMLKLAIKDIPCFDYSKIEINRRNISYTIDTVKELKKSYSQIELIIGYDNFLVFDKWKEPEKLLKLIRLIVLRRKIKGKQIKKNKFFNKAILLETPLVEISGTDIRERVRTGKSIDFLVPQKVKAYIYKHKLYKEKSD